MVFGCRRMACLRRLTHDHDNTSTAQARAGALMSPPPCLDGASHGWVPVDTHSTPVLTTVRRLSVSSATKRHHEHCKHVTMSPHQNYFNMAAERRLNVASLVCFCSVLRFQGSKDGDAQVPREASEWLGSIPETNDRLVRAEKGVTARGEVRVRHRRW